MAMRSIFPMLLVVLVAGCSTPQDIRNHPPAFAGKSAKPKDQIVGCIATGWAEFFGFNMTTIPTPDRTTVILGGNLAGTDMIADVYADGRVEVEKRSATWLGKDKKLIAVVQGCM